MDLETTAAIALIVAIAFTVEAALGFGATVVTVALGSLVVPLDTILPSFVPVNIVLSAVLVARGLRSIAWRTLLVGMAPYIALGMPFGILLAARVDERWLKLGFGVFVVGLSALQLVASARENRADGQSVRGPSAAVGSVLLFAGGVIHGAFATGGPMVVYVVGRKLGSDKGAFRATLSVLWLVLNIVLVTTYAARGRISTASARASAVFVISLAVGLLAGEVLFRRLSVERFRVFVFGMLGIAGAVLVLRNWPL